MKKVKVQDIIDILDSMGLFVNNDRDYLEVEYYLNTGGTYYFVLGKDNILNDIRDAYTNFDMDEYVEEWVIAKHNGCKGVPAVRYLLDDADDIDDILKDILEELIQFERDYKEDEVEDEDEEYIWLGFSY